MKNTKMKKFLAVVLSAALVAGLAAGCGSKEDGKEEDKGSSAKTAKVIDVDLTNEEYAFGIDKDQPELVEQVNAFIKEVKEESGLDVTAKRVIAIQDRNKHNKPLYPYGVCKVFVECEVTGGEFIENIETIEMNYFLVENLPNLSEEKVTSKQIEMCFEAKNNPNWQVMFD